jgi:hypothetical protein
MWVPGAVSCRRADVPTCCVETMFGAMKRCGNP